jgi:arylsulfatase A-like enzyme
MPPNIVMFVADQLRCDALSCYGNAVCRTPHLDALAAEGVRFDRAYATSPVCSPSRASLLSGLYPHNHGVMLNTHIAPAFCRGLPPQTPTFSRLLKEAGYGLDYVGKWHVHADLGPKEFGFDRHVTPRVPGGTVPGTEAYIDFPGGRQLVSAVHKMPKQQCEVARYANSGIELLRERSAADRPFFLRIDIHQPHFASVVPAPYASMYDPAAIPPWPNFQETFAGKPAAHLRKHREWHLQDKDWAWWSRALAMYYGSISYIDECVGRVLAAIREAGIEPQTLFIFTADHADSMGSHRHFEKAGTMYEEVFRVPLIVRMPAGWPAGLEVGDFVRLLDLMPTIVELGGARAPDRLDGRSLVPLLRGQTPPNWPDSVYCEHHGEVWGYQSQRMVRTRRWKYVYNPHDVDELYDLRDDPAEMSNLIEDPAQAGVLGEMKARLLGWNDATNDMFKWLWVRWNFPEPVRPEEVCPEKLPLTCDPAERSQPQA